MSSVSVTFLGGLGDIGRNCAVIEQDGRAVVLDCGVLFASPDEPGIDVILPDLTWLEERADTVDGVVISHGHEDHVGGIVELARIVDAPIYGSPFTLALARNKLDRAGIVDGRQMVEVHDGQRISVGPFDAEFLPITHSIPFGFATAFHTAQGIILHSGDYKLDSDPLDGRVSDLGRIDELASDPGVRLLLADSTNALDEGETGSERAVGDVVKQIVADRPDRRIILGCFSSHIHRVQSAVEAALATDRVVVPIGRSLQRNVNIARDLGILEIDDDHLAVPDQLDDLEPHRTMILSTGSQGEELAGLALMAKGEHRHVSLVSTDTVVFSSTPIPGNEHAISRVVDGMVRKGVEIVDHKAFPVHVSGHARRGEIRVLFDHARPEWFVPVHGEYRHLQAQAELAVESGVAADRVLVVTDGEQVRLDGDGLSVARVGDGNYMYVHGSVDDITSSVLTERRVIGREGVIVISAVVDADRLELVAGPTISTRGWVDRSLSAEIVATCEAAAKAELERVLLTGTDKPGDIEKVMRRAVGGQVSDLTRRRPMLVPALTMI